MKSNLLTGLLAAVAAILLPLVILGMAPPALPSDTPLESTSAPEAPEASPAISPAQRTIQEFVVHRSRPTEEADTPVDSIFHDSDLTVSVLTDGAETQMSLHDYLTGVLMGEVPASYEPEALKAQAVAARTYTLHRLSHGGTLSDDPAVCQAFLPLSSAPEKLGGDWEALLDKLHDAVSETDGLVLTYEGQLISATYFSGSGGRTESAQAVWGNAIPYLVSVESPGEEDTTDYESTVTVPLSEFLTRLDISSPAVSSVSYTTGGGVDTIVIGGASFTGLELRKALGLRSTRFDLAVTEDTVVFDVLGNGHRVGMSQSGAEAMALAGKTYAEILSWYYTGVTLEPYVQ